MNYYIHNVPGRLRLKSPSIKKNKNAVEDVERMLESINGINAVDVNIITGSLLVNYNPRMLKYSDIIDLLQKKGYFDHSKAITNDEYIRNAASKVGEFALTVITSFV